MLSSLTNFFPQGEKNKIIPIILALLGSATPLAGLHKFYLGQPLWGVIYLILSWQSPMIRIACAVDLVIYLAQNFSFNPQLVTNVTDDSNSLPEKIKDIAIALRELEKLRQEGLISEYEFEEKRRQLIT